MSNFRIKRETISLSLTHGASATTANTAAASATAGLPYSGLLVGIIVTTPAAVDASATATINVLDQDANTVWTKGSLAANSKTQVYLTPNATAGTNQAVPLSGYYEVQVVFSAAQTATDTVTKVVLLIDQG